MLRTMMKLRSTTRFMMNRPSNDVERNATSYGVTIAVNSSMATMTKSHFWNQSF